MATEILMPRLGWTMEEGTFGVWLKGDGETVKAGDLLFTVEGDKAIQEVEAFEEGILRLPPNAPKSGDVLPVGALLAYIVKPSEAAPFEQNNQMGRSGDRETKRQREASGSGVEILNTRSPLPNILSSSPSPAISPRARRVALELDVDWPQIIGSGRTGRIVERDVRAAVTQKPVESKLRVTPVAQRMAQEVGLDVVALAKEKGVAKLDRTDIEAAIAERRTLPTQPTLSVLDERISVTHIRRLIADRMVESLQTSAQITLTTEADASALVALRQQLKMALESREMPVPSYNDLLIRLTALALKQHPLLNATWNATEIILHKEIHIGLAVDTEDGLLAPVIRNADAKSVQQIAAETRNLIAKARSRQISAGDLNNGTFTISNLGMYNIDAFTPVINLPQCAILGIGRIVKKPAVVGNQVTIREMIVLSLTFDHRIVDGGPAARFFNQIREYIEEPVLWLVA